MKQNSSNKGRKGSIKGNSWGKQGIGNMEKDKGVRMG